MKEIKGNIWKFHEPNSDNYIVIPTNGFVKQSGHAVMGKGLAKDCTVKYPNFPKLLGDQLLIKGNIPTFFKEHGIITFPVKPVGLTIEDSSDKFKILPQFRKKFRVGMVAPGWMCMADLTLIGISAKFLYHSLKHVNNIYIPRVGCGNGGLDWELVKSVLEKRFKDEPKVIVVHFGIGKNGL